MKSKSIALIALAAALAAFGGTQTTKEYVDTQDAATLAAGKAYSDAKAVEVEGKMPSTNGFLTASWTNNTRVVIGNAASAAGENGVAIGKEARANGGHSLSVGEDSKALGVYSLSFGNGATANDDNNVAIGAGSVASNANAFAVGANAMAIGTNSVAVGNGSSALGNKSVSLGVTTVANGDYSISIGNQASVYGNCSTAIGYNADAHAYKATAIGYGSSATGQGSMAIGSGASATNWESIVIGNGTASTSNDTLRLGFNIGNIIVGKGTNAVPISSYIGGGVSTNAVSGIITNHVTSGYLCTVAEARQMTNATLAAAKEDAHSTYLRKGAYAGTQEIGSTFNLATMTHYGTLDVKKGPFGGGLLNVDETITGTKANLTNLEVGQNSSASNYSVAEGYQSTASGKLSHAAGYRANATKDTAFVWQGTTNVMTSTTTTTNYYDHGKGTFNVNPAGGLAGFWIGETNLADHIGNAAYTKSEADAAYYPKSSGNLLADSVATISAHLNAEDARFVVTNYDSATRTPEAYVEIKVSNDWLRVWSEARRWNDLEPWKTNVTAQLGNKAERAWGIYDSETGGYSPDGFTQISSSNILIASGMAYQRTVTPFNSIWVLQCNQGSAQLGGDTNGYFRIKDGDGNTQFEIVKGNRIELGADASGITVSSVASTSLITIPYSVVANEHPTLQVCTDLGAGNWKAEGETGCPATVSWTGTSGAYVAHVTAPNNLSQMFFKATYLGGSDTIINNNAPVKMQYIYIGNSKYAIGYATINGTGVMTLTPAN